jgi:alkaline phosphatase
MPVLTTAMGVGAEKFSGFIENTDISKIIKSFYE